jgi:ammonia channel protein AmtB
MVLGDSKTHGIFLICLGLWLLPLTWAIYVKYERQRKAQDAASVPLVTFLALSAVGMAGWLWVEYRKRTGAGMGFGGGSDYSNLSA